MKRVALRSANLTSLAEAVEADKEPRVLERDGEPIAAIVSLDDLERLVLRGPTEEGIRRAIEAAGAWKDLDLPKLKQRVDRARHESPPSAPLKL